MQANTQKKALIIGGSMAGLFAGNALHRAGWDVRILEKANSPLISRGAGLATHPGLMKALRHVGAIFDEKSLGVAMDRRFMCTAAGEMLGEVDVPQKMASWARLLQVLLDAFPPERYLLSHGVQRIEDGTADRPARVFLQNGQMLEADLVVGADGIRSEVRKQLFHAPALSYSGYVAWRALADKEKLGKATQAFIGDGFGFSQIPGDQIVVYPVRSSDLQHQIQINVVWYRATSVDQLREILTDDQGRLHAQGIAPNLLRASMVQTARDDACRVLHPAFAEVVNASRELLVQPINDSTTDCMGLSRVALIGDAAFVARPHVGQGVTKAAGDAIALTECLQQHASVAEALQAFSKLRVPMGHLAVQRAQEMGAVIHLARPELASFAAHFAVPANLLRETAVEIPGIAYLV